MQPPMYRFGLFVALFACLTGCARSFTGLPGDDAGVRADGGVDSDAAQSTPDAGAALDAGGRRDAGRVRDAGSVTDSGARDAGDAGPFMPTEDRLASAIWCELTEATVLDTIMRYVACNFSEYYLNAGQIFRSWEAGLLGIRSEASLSALGSFGCGDWRCFAAANSCADVWACGEAGAECTPGEQRCIDGRVESCRRGRWQEVLECAAAGPEFDCVERDGRAFCESPLCTIGEGAADMRCDLGELIVCEGEAGEVRLPCDAVRENSSCSTVRPSGEIPVQFCGPGGDVGAVYGSDPMACDGDVAVLPSLWHGEVRYDCAAAGYSRCQVNVGCAR